MTLTMVSSPLLKDGRVLILKSSNHLGEEFFSVILGASPYGGAVVLVTKGEGRGGIILIKTIIIL